MQGGGPNPELCRAKAWQLSPASFPSHFNLTWHLLKSCVYCHQAFLEGKDLLAPMCLLSRAKQRDIHHKPGPAGVVSQGSLSLSLEGCSDPDGADGEV